MTSKIIDSIFLFKHLFLQDYMTLFWNLFVNFLTEEFIHNSQKKFPTTNTFINIQIISNLQLNVILPMSHNNCYI